MSFCEKCKKDLGENAPGWKKLCGSCWKKGFTKKSSIKEVFKRTGESSYIHNLPRKWNIKQRGETINE